MRPLSRVSIPGSLIVATLLLVGTNPAVCQEPDSSKKYIRNVEIITQEIFPDSVQRTHSPYRQMNFLHITTRERVIRREVLFAPGDSLDQELIDETKRKLRRLPYIGEAQISVHPVNPDSVDITVRTRDQWSTILGFSIQSGGGLTGVGGSFDEYNLFGLGKRATINGFWENDVGMTWTLGYNDRQLVGTRYRLTAGYSTGPLIRSGVLNFSRPLHSPDDKWTYGGGVYAVDEIQRLFNQGVEFSRMKFETQGASGWIRRAFGKRFQKKRVELNYSYQNRDFDSLGTATNSPLGVDEEIYATEAGISVEKHKFKEETQIDKFVLTEDFTLGPTTRLFVGRAGFPIPKGVKRWEIDFEHKHNFQLWTSQFLFLTGGFETLFTRDTILSLITKFYQKAFWRQTFAVHWDFRYAWDLEASSQFVIGGESGLRGYTARAFAGDKRFQLNVEDRIYAPFELLTVASSMVLFADAGFAWQRNQAVDLRDLKYGAGFGFRFGFTRFPRSPVARIDFGWPLSGEGGMIITLGMEQIFSAR